MIESKLDIPNLQTVNLPNSFEYAINSKIDSI